MLALALCLLASGPASGGSVPGPEASVAVFLDTTAGTPALAETVESALRDEGLRVTGASEARAARHFLELSVPLDDESAKRLRRELGVDRLIVVSSRDAGAGEVFLMARFVDEDAIARRFAAAARGAAVDEGVVGLLEGAPPIARSGSASARRTAPSSGKGKGGDGDAAPVIEEYDVPARTVRLTDPPFTSALEHATVLVEGTNGAFYQGVVADAAPEQLQLRVGAAAKRMTFRAGEVKSMRTLRPAVLPVHAGESGAFHFRDGSTVEGDVIESQQGGALVRKADGTRAEVRWGYLLRVEVPAARRRVDVVEPSKLGLVPVLANRVEPKYPGRPDVANMTGVVVVELVVDITGRVVRTKLIRSSPMFDAAALDAVSRWVYQPLVLEGRAVSWRGPVTLRFEWRGGAAMPVRTMPQRASRAPEPKPVIADRVESEPPRPEDEDSPDVEGPMFGEARTLELGAVFGYVNSTRSWDIEGTHSRVQGADLLVRPTIGYFPHDGFELILRPGMRRNIAYYSGPDETAGLSWSLAVGVAYFSPVGEMGMLVGAQATGGVFAMRSRDTSSDGTLHITEGGRLGTLGLATKVPVGSAAMMTVELNYFAERSDVRLRLGSARAAGTGTLDGVELTFGFSFWRPGRD